MTVRFLNGQVLFAGGAVATHADCCCCDFVAQLQWDVQNGVLRALVAYRGANGPALRVTLTRNGVVEWTVNQIFVFFDVANPNPGDVFVLTAEGAGCTATATCEISNYGAQPACTYVDPRPIPDGTCLTPAEYQGIFRPMGSISGEISGLTGQMAALNGVYAADCNGGSGAEVRWRRSLTGEGPREFNWGGASAGIVGPFKWSVGVRYVGTDNPADCIPAVCDPSPQPTRIGGSRITRMDEEAFVPWQWRSRAATCAADCGGNVNQFYVPGGIITEESTSNGVPAEGAIISVTRIGGGV